jgi:ParB family chromosome partitioning protein
MAQIRDHDAIQAKRDFFMVDPRKLSVDPTYNVRDLTTPDAREGLDELKAMVRADGVQIPLVVRLIGDDLTIVQGHRRHTVVMELIAEGEDIKAIPAIAEPKGVNDADRTFDLLRSNSGQPLAPLEIAEVVKRLINYGWTEAQIAQRRGWKSTQTVTNYLSMLEMPEVVKDHVKNGHVSATLARELTKTKDGEQADQVIREQLEVRKANGKKAKVTRKAITRTREPQPEPEQDQRPGDIKLLDALAPIVGTLTDLANQAFDDGRSEASVPVTLLQSLDTIIRQARGE